MKRIISFMKDYKKESILAPLFKMLEASLELFVPLVVASIIDEGIANGDRSYILWMCFLLLVLALIGLVCSVTAQYFAAKSAVGAATAMRSRLFAHIQTFGYAELDAEGTSTLITRMTSDINQVQSGINMVLRLFLRSPCIVVGAVIMAFTIDGRAARIFVVTVLLLSAVVFGVMFLTRPIYRKVQQGLDQILGITRENLTGVRVIRAFRREEGEYRRFFAANEALTGFQKFAGKISGLTNPLTFVIINYAILILIHMGALRVDAGSLTQGQVVALYNYMSQILVELIKLANLIVLLTRATACVRRIDEVFEKEVPRREGRLGAMEERENAAAVVFDHVSFTYPGGGEEALSDITFSANPGETIGIIGGTGSGKSTVVRLIPRFYDATRGTVSLYGRNVADYTDEALRDAVAVVPQKAQLFAGTIRENLCFGLSGVSDERLLEALATAQALEFVEQKEGGLDYRIEQGGRNLSGGQKQRLTLARALVRRSKILILDDSASALDYATDAKLRRAIRERKEASTVFIVSQRASSLLYADRILVLDEGEMAGLGTHRELLASCALYREIYETQFKKTDGKEAGA